MTELARESVVEIQTRDATGTGWIYRVDRNGRAWILTNEHVVRGSRTVTVRLSGNGGTRIGTVIGQDDIRDLAVLTICCNTNWDALPTVSPTMVRQGTQVAVLGYPGGRIGADLAVTTGIVSSFGFHDETRSWLIQTDAAINPGNSGGPMINSAGEVIGIVSSRRDPVHAENIGFAIAMRTVDEELDYLEVGSTVRAATATPTRVATRVPTVGPSTHGESGMLVHDPDDGLIDCSNNRYDATVITTDSIDSAAFLRFQVPDVNRWSIGVIYHEGSVRNTSSQTFIYTDDNGRPRTRHLVRDDGEHVHDPPSERIPSNILRSDPGEWNELSFRTTSNGTFLRLNDETVREVPASQLVRRSGWSTVCVGFHSDENEAYSVSYADLRARFERDGASGNLAHDGIDDGHIECPEWTWQSAYIDQNATDAWLVFDFTLPSVSDWSLGVVYHDNILGDSRTVIYRDEFLYYAQHDTYRNDEFVDGPSEYLSSSLLNTSSGDTNRLELNADNTGSSLYLNGEKVLDVPLTDLTRMIGSVRLCVEMFVGEDRAYAIGFSNLWAWTD